jgi:hypothetical protein
MNLESTLKHLPEITCESVVVLSVLLVRIAHI